MLCKNISSSCFYQLIVVFSDQIMFRSMDVYLEGYFVRFQCDIKTTYRVALALPADLTMILQIELFFQ